MATLTFPLVQFKVRGYSPIVRVKLINPSNNKSVSSLALIDTGSEKTIFPALEADRLGHNLRAGKKIFLEGFNGSTSPAYLHASTISLTDLYQNNVDFRSPTYFSEAVTRGYGLVGVSGFLSHFKLTIDYRHRLILLEEHK